MGEKEDNYFHPSIMHLWFRLRVLSGNWTCIIYASLFLLNLALFACFQMHGSDIKNEVEKKNCNSDLYFST